MSKRGGMPGFVWVAAWVGLSLLMFYASLAWQAHKWTPMWEIRYAEASRSKVRISPASGALRYKMPAQMSAVERGRWLFHHLRCAVCHGIDGRGGVRNPNSQTAEQVTGLRYVAEGFTKEELIQKIKEGVSHIAKKDKNGPEPPLRMPSWRNRLGEQELNDLAAYLFSLLPEEDEDE